MQRFRNILVVCDDDQDQDNVLDRAATIAAHNDARVTLIDIVDAEPGELARLFAGLPGRQGGELEDQIMLARRDRLQGLAERLRAQGLDVALTVRFGTPFIEIIRRVIREEHDLVLKGALKASRTPFLLGPDMHLLRKCPCPVWIMNHTTTGQTRRILAAVDPDPDDRVRDGLNRMIMQLATSLAEQDDARLDVLSVWRLPEESTLRSAIATVPKKDIDALVERERRESAWRLSRLTEPFADPDERRRVLHIKGVASDTIPEHVEAEGIDTIVMGTVARTGIAGFLIGNTAETILSRVPCSVLTVKPEGFTTPVKLGEMSAEALA